MQIAASGAATVAILDKVGHLYVATKQQQTEQDKAAIAQTTKDERVYEERLKEVVVWVRANLKQFANHQDIKLVFRCPSERARLLLNDADIQADIFRSATAMPSIVL